VADDRLSRVLRRRWYVVLCGAALTLVVGAFVWQSTGLHYHRAEVVFGMPGTRAGFEQDLPSGGSLIPFASAVGRLAGQDQGLVFPATRAELHASGVRSGTWIRLVDTGGQWTRSFSAPTLVVEAVDPDPARAEALFEAALGRVEDATVTLQDDASVAGAERVVPVVQHDQASYVGPNRSTTVRAMAVVLGLGAVLTLLAARGMDVVMGRGRHRVTPPQGRPVGSRHDGSS
jgi:hypothetical protein